MYCFQITLPHAQHEGSENTKEIHRPDNFIINIIFEELHGKQYLCGDNFKYAIGFPEITEDSLGRTMQIFTQKKEDIQKLFKINEKLFNVVSNYCKDFKTVEIINIEKYPQYALKFNKSRYKTSLSKVKRAIKRADGEIFKMSKSMSPDEIVHKINTQKENKERHLPFVKYESKSNNNKISFFVEKQNVDFAFDINKFNNFGFSGTSANSILESSLPMVIF